MYVTISLRKSSSGYLNWKGDLRFFTKQINPRPFGSGCIKETEESSSRVDSSVPLTHHGPRDLGLICLEKEMQNPFLDLRIRS